MDNTPDYNLAQQRLRFQISELDTAIERNRVAVMEIIVKQNQNLINMAAANQAIDLLNKKLLDTPDIKNIEKQRIRSSQCAQQANIERQTLENMEGLERAIKHEEAISSSIGARLEYQRQLDGLELTHGILDYGKARDELFGYEQGT